MHRTHVLWDGAAGIITKHTSNACLGIIMVMIPLDAPSKFPNHNIHRDMKLSFVMLVYHVLPKKLPIWDIFHIGNSCAGSLSGRQLN